MDIYLCVAYRGQERKMSTLLKIDVSPRGDYSISRKLANHFATEWQSNHVGGTIITRDLATTKMRMSTTTTFSHAMPGLKQSLPI